MSLIRHLVVSSTSDELKVSLSVLSKRKKRFMYDKNSYQSGYTTILE